MANLNWNFENPQISMESSKRDCTGITEHFDIEDKHVALRDWQGPSSSTVHSKSRTSTSGLVQ